jgi:hypothetical protein
MERESFEDETVAEFLNTHFVAIKVDREERPDLDEIYMSSVQILTGSGGWPMSVFLTSSGKPFYGGTYFPPVDMQGRPSFMNVLKFLSQAWDERHDEVLKGAEQLTTYVQKSVTGRTGDRGGLSPELLAGAAADLKSSFDSHDGGFGGAPKFPSAPSIELLLRQYLVSGDIDLLRMATFTLDKMAAGGMYDQLGGGFHRYSVDEEWLVPHFEKMLYDNAQLAQAYLEAFQLTRNPVYRRVAAETLDYVLRDMIDEGGAFHSAEDADSEGEEGKFYIWTQQEILSVLGPEDGAAFCTYYAVLPDGNFSSHETYHRGQNILHMPHTAAEVAIALKMEPAALETKIAACRDKLMAVRGKRVRPHKDDKVLTSWNGLMIGSLARGYEVLGDVRYRVAAEKAANFILNDMTKDGELLRTHRKGVSRIPAFLDDYAFMSFALVDLYEATFDRRWLDAADSLAKKMLTTFWDTANGGFFFTPESNGGLIARSRPTYDGAEPSGNSVAAFALLRLAKLTDNATYQKKAVHALEINRDNMSSSPRAFLRMLCAADFLLNSPKEIAIVGHPGGEDTAALLRVVHENFIPNKVVAFADASSSDAAALESRIPLLASKHMVDGKAAAFVCKEFTCKAPVTTPDALLAALDLARKG